VKGEQDKSIFSQIWESDFKQQMEAWFTTGSDEHAMMFIDSYKARYGLDPRGLSMFSIYAYDGFRLLNQAIKSGDVLGYLRSVKNFQGASGQLSADGMNGFTFPVAIRKLSR
jgi:ABC-type branched-subunit amino acid transport system substrate-binding protein